MANTNVTDVGTLVAETKAEITGQKAEDKVDQLIQNPGLLNQLIATYEDSCLNITGEPEKAKTMAAEADKKRKEFEALLYLNGLDLGIFSRACDRVYSCQDLGD